MEFLCQSALDGSHCKPGCSQLDVGDVVSNLFESNVAGEGHCATKNADKANEVQQNAVTTKKGKARHKNNYHIPSKYPNL